MFSVVVCWLKHSLLKLQYVTPVMHKPLSVCLFTAPSLAPYSAIILSLFKHSQRAQLLYKLQNFRKTWKVAEFIKVSQGK